ncbi:MAG: putative phosphatase [Bacteroidetes bacterium]|nr:putative phosphatase [Bacteroidota bacterium]
MANLERLSCVIFDIDGTLARTNDLIFATFNHVAELHLGRRYEPQEIIAHFGPPEEGAVESIFGSAMVSRVMDEMCAYYRAHHKEMAGAHEGILAVLALLKRHGTRLAVFTGKGRRTAAITLAELGMTPFFEHIVTGNDVTAFKPSPEGIHQVLETFAVSPRETVMVGDSMSDFNAARAAGVAFAAVLWDAYDHHRVIEACPDFLFHTVAEFEAWCRSRLNGAAAD